MKKAKGHLFCCNVLILLNSISINKKQRVKENIAFLGILKTMVDIFIYILGKLLKEIDCSLTSLKLQC